MSVGRIKGKFILCGLFAYSVSIITPSNLQLSIVGFTAGLLTGSSQGAVAITFPLVAAVSSQNVSLAVIAYVAGFAGHMLLPAHLCLLVTLDYFKADFLRTQRSIAMLSLFLLLVLTIKTTILYIPC